MDVILFGVAEIKTVQSEWISTYHEIFKSVDINKSESSFFYNVTLQQFDINQCEMSFPDFRNILSFPTLTSRNDCSHI